MSCRPARPRRHRHRRVAWYRQGTRARARRTGAKVVCAARTVEPAGERTARHDPRDGRRDPRRRRHRDSRCSATSARTPTSTRLVDATVAEYGRVDSLVNNAMTPTRASFADSTVEQWDESMRVNVRSLYLFTKAVVPTMQRTGGGSIVNISSGGAEHAIAAVHAARLPHLRRGQGRARALLERGRARAAAARRHDERAAARRGEDRAHDDGVRRRPRLVGMERRPSRSCPRSRSSPRRSTPTSPGACSTCRGTAPSGRRSRVTVVALRLYDTAQRAVVPFEPPPKRCACTCAASRPTTRRTSATPRRISRTTLLIRRLEELGHEVRYVRNITDVDDSILPKARELGVPYLELAESEMARFHSDMAALEMRPPIAEPRATEADRPDHRPRRPAARERVTRTSRTAPCTSTCRRSRATASCRTTPTDQMLRLARARGGNPDDPHRRQPLDFVLWQPSLDDEPAWRAPFGVGRPGWHIECSAMAMHEHGPTLDLHGGGTDLIFPHHECEIAQSESLTGEPFARHWLHSAMVNYEGEKMSKSLGNLVFVSDLLKVGRPARDSPRAAPPSLPPRLRVVRHRSRRRHRAAAPAARGGRAHRPVPTRDRSRSACATRSTTTSTRRARSTRSTISRARSSRAATTRARAHVLCELGQLLGVNLERPIAIGAPGASSTRVRESAPGLLTRVRYRDPRGVGHSGTSASVVLQRDSDRLARAGLRMVRVRGDRRVVLRRPGRGSDPPTSYRPAPENWPGSHSVALVASSE